MIDAIIVALAVISAVWVYLDATKNKIGKISGGKGLFNMSAGAWGAVASLIWIIGFPAYLIKRGDMIEKAKENPVEVNGRGGKTAAFSILGGLWVIVTYSGAAFSALPGCESSETKSLVGQIINDMPLVKGLGAEFVEVKNVVEQGYNHEGQLRSCSGTLVTTAGEDNLQYSVKWVNEDKLEFYVTAAIQ